MFDSLRSLRARRIEICRIAAVIVFITLFPDQTRSATSPDAPATAVTLASPESDNGGRTLSLLGGKFLIDLSRYPISGSISAQHCVVIITDYTCPYCRDTEKAFIEALGAFEPGAVALVHLPGIREKKDGPALHRIMLALWQEHPAIYRRLSRQIFFGELPAETAKVRAAAATLLGGVAVLDALVHKHSAWIDDQIQQTSQLMVANAKSSARIALPQILIGDQFTTGSISNPAELQDEIERQLKITPTHRIYSPERIAANLDDPCEPSRRQSCGRLVLSIIGAGEATTDITWPEDKTVPDDKHGYEGTAHLLQFSAGSNAKLTSEHIVFTSDPEVKALARNLPFTRKAALAGVVDASFPAFSRMVSPDDADSPLNKAIASFAKNPDCQKLMNGATSVLPYLKVDIIIDGELSETDASGEEAGKYGIAVFKREGTVGTLARWLKDGTVIGKKEVSLLLGRLRGAFVNVFIKTCKAGRLQQVFDDAIDESGSCGCVLAVSDDIQDHFSGGRGSHPAFNYAMPDRGSMYTKIPRSDSFGQWDSARVTIAKMAVSLLAQEEILIMNPLDPKAQETAALRDIVQHRNPLFGFAYTSSDALTNRLLALLREESATAAKAKEIGDSEFVREIRRVQIPRYRRGERMRPFDADVVRIKNSLREAERQLGSMIDRESMTNLESTIHDQALNKFDACLLNAGEAPAFCSAIERLIHDIIAKMTQNAKLSQEEALFTKEYNRFMGSWRQARFFSVYPAYIQGTLSLNDFLTKMAAAKLAWIEFKRGTESLLQPSVGTRMTVEEKSTLEQKRKAFGYFDECFNTAFDSCKSQVFDQLKKESITTKLMRTEAAVDLLAQNIDAIGKREECGEVTRRLASKLTCQTRYIIGPAHDQNPPGPMALYQTK